MKRLTLIFLFFTAKLFAQDAVLISEGNFVRGVIQGTNFESVALLQEDQTVVSYRAKDIQSFLWNGETYVSKPIPVGKKMEYRFFKLIESGTVNLYSYGDKGFAEQAQQPRAKAKPSFGIGIGSGGFGGGFGGGITIGGGRRGDEPVNNAPRGKVSYFLERPGTGPMTEISLDAGKLNATKAFLLQKLTNDEDLAERIKATELFTEKNLPAFVKAYNEMKK